MACLADECMSPKKGFSIECLPLAYREYGQQSEQSWTLLRWRALHGSGTCREGRCLLNWWPVADPGFQRRGTNPWFRSENLSFGKIFPRKLHENERNWTWGRVPSASPLGWDFPVDRQSYWLADRHDRKHYLPNCIFYWYRLNLLNKKMLTRGIKYLDSFEQTKKNVKIYFLSHKDLFSGKWNFIESKRFKVITYFEWKVHLCNEPNRYVLQIRFKSRYWLLSMTSCI